MQRLKRIGIGILVLAAIIWGADWLVYLLRKQPTGTVDVRVFYAVALKGKKTEYLGGDPQTQTCAGALLPHNGNVPCWWLERHKEQWVDINSGAPHPMQW